MPAYAYLQLVDRNPQKKYVGQENLTPCYEDLTTYIQRLVEFKDSLGPEVIEAKIDTEAYDGRADVIVAMYRMETAEETEERVAKVEAYNAKAVEHRRKLYDSLAKEFGDKK